MPELIQTGRRFCVAPMLDLTDRHARYFLRLISRHAWLYTEMVTTGALLHGDHHRYLAYHQAEHPLALQLGGSDPSAMARCTRMAEDYGYDEVNINVGCPSDRVRNGLFGACLMATPERVAECVDAMCASTQIPVTIKTRIGIDNQDDYEFLHHFIQVNQEAGCDIFIIHARKAWLQGLSPKENREVPPLNYERVYQIKKDFPELEIILNGGLTDLDTAQRQLDYVDGVMLGRVAYHQPWLLSEVDHRFYGDEQTEKNRREIVEQMLPYVEEVLQEGGQLKFITRHMLGLFHGVPGARHWRRILSEEAWKEGAGIEVIRSALEQLEAQGSEGRGG
jgi:tRNA-dihydrouridine synthase A